MKDFLVTFKYKDTGTTITCSFPAESEEDLLNEVIDLATEADTHKEYYRFRGLLLSPCDVLENIKEIKYD